MGLPTPSALASGIKARYEAGEYYGAAARISQIGLFSEYGANPALAEVLNLRFNETEWAAAQEQARSHAAQLLQVLSVPSFLEDEEIFLIVTIRIDLGLFIEFGERHGMSTAELPIAAIDEAILGVRADFATDRRFLGVIRAIRRNSGLALSDSSVAETVRPAHR